MSQMPPASATEPRLVNFTPHHVTIMHEDGTATIIPSDGDLRLSSEPQATLDPVRVTPGGRVVAVTSPQVFNGFAEPMPTFDPAAMLGVIVPAVVGEYMVANDLLPERVPVYSPGVLVRDACGAIYGTKNLVRYTPK